jgi:hypothetical protein
MSISSTQGPVTYFISALPAYLTVTFPFNLAADLGVSDGATILTLGSDYTLVSGGGYNGANQLQTGIIEVVTGGAGNVQPGDVITIYRNISPVQTTSFSSTGLLTPLMIETDDDKLTTLVQQLKTNNYNPFPPAGAIFSTSAGSQTLSGSTEMIVLGWITAQTGGIRTSIDSLNVVGIPTLQLPLCIMVMIGGFKFIWMLRPMQVGDPSASVAYVAIVPVVNPNSLIWVLVG